MDKPVFGRRRFGQLGLIAGLSVLAGALELRSARRTLAAEPPIIAAADWQAQPPLGPIRALPRRAHGVVLHHTGKPPRAAQDREQAGSLARQIQAAHLERGWVDTGQNFTVTAGGLILEGRQGSLEALRLGGRHIVGTHTPGLNETYLGIECEGDYTWAVPPPALYGQLVALLAYICQQYELPASSINGHQAYTATECPGRTFHAAMPQLRADVDALLRQGRPAAWPLLEEGDWSRPVLAAQYLLRHHGADLTASGVFDAVTASAVAQVRRALGLPAGAGIGGELWPRLVVAVAEGDSGPAVSALQVGLGVAVDGVFGPATAAALRSRRERAGLPPDGPADEAAWQAALA